MIGCIFSSRMVCFSEKCKDTCPDASCGPNSDCRVTNHEAVCRCQTRYRGNPPNCRLETTTTTTTTTTRPTTTTTAGCCKTIEIKTTDYRLDGMWNHVMDRTGQVHNGRPVYTNRNMQVAWDLRSIASTRFVKIRLYMFMNNENRWIIKRKTGKGENLDHSFHRKAITSLQSQYAME